MGIGNVKTLAPSGYGDKVVLAVERLKDIWTVLIPILICNKLQSPKILDFIDFFKAAIIISLGKGMTNKDYCIKLKSGIHSGRNEISFYLAYPIRITLNWLVAPPGRGLLRGMAVFVLVNHNLDFQ